jgi:membrane protein YdbS with pleckstrin-like domain
VQGNRGRVLQFSVALLFPLIVGLVTYFVVGFFSKGAKAARRRKAPSLETVGGPEQQLHKGNVDRTPTRWFRPVALMLIGASGSFVFVWYSLSSNAWSTLSASIWEVASFR